MESIETRLAIVGAGAAGLWAAATAARAGADVLVLEKTPRTGTKVLASGGSRCNLTTTLDARGAGELFGRDGAKFLQTALRVTPPSAVRERFHELGVETEEAPLEKVFPKSGRALDVRDALERDARDAGARILLGAGVRGFERVGATWRVELVDGRVVVCQRLIVCPGGASYAGTGTTGDGYAWLERLGLPIVEPVPALVPLTSPAAWARELSGIAIQDVDVRLVEVRATEGTRTLVARRRRPVLFTHQGLSGPGAMDVSDPVARAHATAKRRRTVAPTFAVELDVLPDLTREAVRDLLIEAAGRAGAPSLSRVLPVELPKRVLHRFTAQAGLGETDPRPNQLDKASRHRLVESLKGLSVPIDGTLGFDHAEVTSGGLALTHVEPGTMRVRGHEGLYACGEILDVTGPIGGLNFQAAFATAELAARDAAR